MKMSYNSLHYLTEYLNYFRACVPIPFAVTIDFHTLKEGMNDYIFHYLNDFEFV